GYASIACWFVVFTPQLYENYTRKNTDGVSVQFLLFWIFGDIFNLLGVILDDLLFTMLLIAAYYLLADSMLMGQVIYYRRYYRNDSGGLIGRTNNDTSKQDQDDETTHLLGSTVSDDDEDGATLRSRSDNGGFSTRTRKIFRYFVLFATIFSIATVGLSALFFFGSDEPVDLSQWHPTAQILGYLSALLYCASRIPQIMQNFRTESVEGLSFLMFVFSVTGNLTYCASIFLKSLDRTYLLVNYPWLLGSGGTLFFDFTVLEAFL
ncbi:PQ loop repeat-domain-containing protein, partial [Dichotomocladium elegans]